MRGSARRVGVLGGSFDPVHIGHLILAQEALHRLRLDELLLMPARRPAHKLRRSLAPAAHRIAMLRLAARGRPGLRVSRIEVDRPGVSYTAPTLEALARGGDATWFLLMGEDNLAEFHTWRDPARILRLARLAVVPREGERIARIPAALRRRVVSVPMPRIGISSTEIRRRARRGLPLRDWVPEAVLAYMKRHGLYGIGRR